MDFHLGDRPNWHGHCPTTIVVFIALGLLVDRGGWHMAFLASPLAFTVIKEPEQAAELHGKPEVCDLSPSFRLLRAIAMSKAALLVSQRWISVFPIARGMKNVATA